MREAKWGWGKTRAMFAAIVISSACLGVASIASAGVAPGAESVDDLKSTIEQLVFAVANLSDPVIHQIR